MSFSWVKQPRSSDVSQTAWSWAFLAGLPGIQDPPSSFLLCKGAALLSLPRQQAALRGVWRGTVQTLPLKVMILLK